MPAHLIAEEGPHKGLLLDLQEGKEWIVGRDPDASDFVIEDSTVSRKAARLTRTSEGIFVKNLSRVNPVLVNGEEQEESVLLKEGDRVQIGNTPFLYSEKAFPETGTRPKKPKKKKKGGYDDIFGEMKDDAPREKAEAAEAFERTEERAELPPPPSPPEAPSERAAYDTIFESGEENLPFNLISETPLVLKVISGPNAGAEIGLEKGRDFTLGKDSNVCDIVFQDLSVSRTHARLSISPDGTMEIEDLGSKNGTVVNGLPITEKRIVTPQDMIALGTTVFLIIDREAPQETIYSAVVPSFEAPQTVPVEKQEETPPIAEKKKETHWKEERIPGKHLIAAGAFLLVFLIIFLSFFSLFKSKGLEVVKKEPVSEIQEALDKFKDVQFSYNPGSGKLFLAGHVLTSVDYQEMRYRISQIPFIASTEDNVVIDEYVWKMMNDVLSDNAGWRGVSISSHSPGKFVVNGYILTNDEAAQLSEYLTVNFPYLDRLENKVVVEETLNAQIQSMLTTRNFGAVAFQLSNGDIVLTGRYSDKTADAFNEMLKELKAIPGVSSVKNFAIASHPDLASIDLSQQYQVTGSSMYEGRGYSVVLNGKIYTLGDLVDGMKITSILSNTILLEKDGLKYKIDYTR